MVIFQGMFLSELSPWRCKSSSESYEAWGFFLNENLQKDERASMLDRANNPPCYETIEGPSHWIDFIKTDFNFGAIAMRK